MSVFSTNDFDDHETVVFHSDPHTGLKAIIAIHNSNLGPALGGCRMWPYDSEADAITDVLRLSRGMTYKAAMANLPFGGGKSVIIGDPRTDKSEALLAAMGRFVESQGGRYHTAEDVGTTVADMDIMRRETTYAHGFSDGTGNPSPATAFGVFRSIEAAVKHWFGRDSVTGTKVAVQGLGNVGATLCRYLAENGASLVVTDIDPARIERVVGDFGATAVGPDAILDADADVFAPCALGAVINDDAVARLKVAAISGAANNQLAEARHGADLKKRGILYAPDYVVNAGGLIDIAHEGPGYTTEKALNQVSGIYDTLREVFDRARREDAQPEVVADRMAEERFRNPVMSSESEAA